MDKIELLRKGREKYEILVVTRHVQGEEQKREGALASSFLHEKSHQTVASFEEVYRNSGGKALSKMSIL